jgi:hypothetical protein
MRILIILALVGYVLYKVGGLFFQAGAASQQARFKQRRPQDAANTMDSAPDKPKRAGHVKGGEYVDYEEVK